MLNLYDFLKFRHFLEFPELFLNLKIPEKPLLRQHDIKLTSVSQQELVQVKHDMWARHVSVIAN